MKRHRKPGKARAAAEVPLPPPLQAIVTKVDRAIDEQGSDDYAIGDAWNQLKAKGMHKLIKEAGLTNRTVFWDTKIKGRVRHEQARILGILVDHFRPEAFVLAVGVLNDFLKYCARAGVEPQRDPRQQLVRVPGPAETFEDVPLWKCTRKDVEAAIERLPPRKGGRGRPKAKLPAIAHVIVVETSKRIEKAIGDGAVFSVRMLKDEDRYSLTDVSRGMVRLACKGWLEAMDAAGA